jgi:hypothetical protein
MGCARWSACLDSRTVTGLAKSSLVDARDQLTAQGDLFVHAGGRVELTDPFLAAWVLHGTPRQ